VRIDETRRGDQAGGVEFPVRARVRQLANGGDVRAADADIGAKARRLGAVDNAGVADDEVEVFVHGLAQYGVAGALAFGDTAVSNRVIRKGCK
jgi:hypothetical protein